MHCVLERAAPLLRLPTSPDQSPEVLSNGLGLCCPVTGRTFLYRDGILDLLGEDLKKTLTQHTLDTPFTAWAYDRFRGWLIRALNSPDFPLEVATIQQALQAQADDIILDLACGARQFYRGVGQAGRARRAGDWAGHLPGHAGARSAAHQSVGVG